jgi:transposase InsO family protein
MCRVLEVGRGGYYAWLHRSDSPRRLANLRLQVAIKEIHIQSRQTYGSPRIHAELRDRGHVCGRHRVTRLMREHHLRSVHRRKFKATTDSKHALPVAENTLALGFDVTAPNRRWVADITYIPTREGWLYLAVTVDLFHRVLAVRAMGNLSRNVLR